MEEIYNQSKTCQDIINGTGAARDAFKEGAPVASSDEIGMTFVGDVPEKVIAVHNVEEETAVVTKTVVVNKDVVIKAKEVEEDSLGNTLTEDDYEPFVVKTVVKTFSDD